ncbi:hypothetical protein IAI61_22745 [Roseomonas sp. 573]|uniref:Uncharacterized protein n=1 Tax=Roseomonas haemaphysalidis TaxID=2768162 RepID=A0ABS3KWK2_9PROT|nr:hypothetical protein [Roseomonas haemaphysalidis]
MSTYMALGVDGLATIARAGGSLTVTITPGVQGLATIARAGQSTGATLTILNAVPLGVDGMATIARANPGKVIFV